MGAKMEKAVQRRKYHDDFKDVKHGHGTRAVRKKQESALARGKR
jgi:hypothetical protein